LTILTGSPSALYALDGYEPDEPPGPTLLVGETQARDFDPQGDVDYASLRVKGGRAYRVATDNLAPGVDTVLTVTLGVGIYVNDDLSTTDFASEVAFTAQQDGDAYVEIANVGELFGPTKGYSLTAELLGAATPTPIPTSTPTPSPTPTATPMPDAYEPDDTSAVEGAIPLLQQRTFQDGDDVDRVTFPVKAGQGYYALTSPDDGTDTILQVHVDGQTFEDDDGNGGLGSRVVFFPEQDGWAEAVVWEKWGRNGNDRRYTLEVDVHEGSDEDEDQDNAGGALIPLGTSRRRAFHVPDDVDHARVSVTDDMPVVIVATGNEVIPHLTVRQGGKSWVVDGSTSGGRAEVRFTSKNDGEVTLEIRSLTGETGSYTLSAQRGADPTPQPQPTSGPSPTPAPVADRYEVDDEVPAVYYPGQVQARAFQAPGDVDQVVFTAKAGHQYEARTTTLAAGVDTTLTLYDFDGGGVIGGDDDSGAGMASLITFGPYGRDRRIKAVVSNRGRFAEDATYVLEVKDLTESDDGEGSGEGPAEVVVYVFLDHDGDGSYDPLEEIDRVRVNLRLEGGGTLARNTTDGRASFSLTPDADEEIVCDVLIPLLSYGNQIRVSPGGRAEVHVAVRPVPLPVRLP
jgi:hypothetical protein